MGPYLWARIPAECQGPGDRALAGAGRWLA